MKFKVLKNSDGAKHITEFEVDTGESKLTVLDALISARDEDPELAFRYGCRNRLCGICTVNVNGKPRLACRTPARDNMLVEPPIGLPVLQDLVVRRDGINQQLNGKLPTPVLNQESRTQNHQAYDSLGRCIECYACLDGCPLHQKNELGDATQSATLEHANPYSFLRMQRNLCHPAIDDAQSEETIALATKLGLESCVGCDGCTCGVGIDLMKEVIAPLLEQAKIR